MFKKIILVIILTILDILAYIYLDNSILNLKSYEYKYSNKPLIYLNKKIELYDINDFVFEDYFEVLDFNNNSYKYYIDSDNKQIIIKLKDYDDVYYYNYEIIEPEIVTEYIRETIYVDNNEYSDYEDNHIYYSCDYYEFELGTDISCIIQTVQDDIESYTNVTCDYSCLNPYILGTYDIYFYNDFEKVIKKVKII